MAGWNFAASWEAIAMVVPERAAIVCGDRRVTWGEFADRARRLAWHLEASALTPGDRIAIHLTNRPEYLETFFAALLLGCAPVNVDYRSRVDDVHAILDHSDAKAVVTSTEHARTVTRAARRIPKPWRPRVLEVGSPYEHAIGAAAPPADPPHAPSGDDLILLYAKDAAGRPSGAVWRNDDLYLGIWSAAHPEQPDPPDPMVTALEGSDHPVVLPAAPLAHGTGLFASLAALVGSGTVVLVDRPGLNVVLLWDAVERERVDTFAVVGDGFARPLLAALDAEPGRWDLSSLRAVTSSGARFSADVRRGLRAHLGAGAVVDASDTRDASDEADAPDAPGSSDAPPPMRRRVSERIRVVDELTGRDVRPGSGDVGLVALGGHLPMGYHKDPERTRATFKLLDGERYSFPGDYAMVDEDGTVRPVGSRPPIATGGETVDPGAIERALKQHPSVADCAVVGVPSAGRGEQVVALVEVTDGHYIDEVELSMWSRRKLAAHETPRRFLFVETIDRSPSGSAPYATLRALAIERLRDR
ncbi:MAG TPA: AMP-binding protein [Acidimicrobiia bacterium]|nr:AMP-binding protein [Acidimicrobiia bacterium]